MERAHRERERDTHTDTQTHDTHTRTQVLESMDTCHLFMEHCQGGELLSLMDHMEFDGDGLYLFECLFVLK